MLNHRVITLFFTVVMLMAGICDMQARKKKHSRRGLDVEELDLIPMPQPDAPVPALVPQPRMSAEVLPGEQTMVRAVSRRGRGGGIDVSHYQGNIDWREVARSGEVQYVYIKATEGSNLVDNTFRINLNGARRAGFKVGIYHFYRPNATVEAQFANLTSTVALRDMDLIPIIDVENRGREPLDKFRTQLLRFARLVEKHYGVRPIIYTSRDFYNKYLAGPFTGYKYMIARYHDEVPVLVDNAQFVMWQYTASGRLRGIRGNVDKSCFMDNYNMKDILMPKRK